METRHDYSAADVPETWTPWPVCWSAAWVGALAALAALVVFGLTGVALGLHLSGPDARIVDWRKVFWGSVACSVASAFFAFVIGGWIAGRIGGYTRSEPAMLHGSIAWLLGIPMLIVVILIGGGSYLGSWYSGLGGQPTWTTPAAPAAASVPAPAPLDQEAQNRLVDKNRKATRNAALTAVASLLLGLIGSVLGGWMASGEPMTLTHHLTRQQRLTAASRSETAGRPLTSV
jgi:hypothetical protein